MREGLVSGEAFTSTLEAMATNMDHQRVSQKNMEAAHAVMQGWDEEEGGCEREGGCSILEGEGEDEGEAHPRPHPHYHPAPYPGPPPQSSSCCSSWSSSLVLLILFLLLLILALLPDRLPTVGPQAVWDQLFLTHFVTEYKKTKGRAPTLQMREGQRPAALQPPCGRGRRG